MLEQLYESVLKSEATKNAWRHKHDSTEFRNASKLNQIAFGKPLNKRRKCECIEDLFLLIKNPKTKERIMSQENQLFKLKEHKHISLHCGVFTQHSNDEQLIKLLNLHPGHIIHFERYPDNWEEIVSGKAKAPKQEAQNVDEVDPVEDVQETEEGGKGYNQEELMSMKNAELKKIITDAGNELPEKTNKASLVDAILNA